MVTSHENPCFTLIKKYIGHLHFHRGEIPSFLLSYIIFYPPLFNYTEECQKFLFEILRVTYEGRENPEILAIFFFSTLIGTTSCNQSSILLIYYCFKLSRVIIISLNHRVIVSNFLAMCIFSAREDL